MSEAGAILQHQAVDAKHVPGKTDPAQLLRYDEHEVMLDLGECEVIDVLRDGKTVYAIGVNYQLNHAGIQAFADGKETGRFFSQDADGLEERFLDFGPVEMLHTLIEYLDG